MSISVGDHNAGAVAFGGPQQTAPANPFYTVGEIGFGPTWSDDEPSLRQMYDAACQTIVRMQHQLEEANARIAVLEEQSRILVAERDEARAQYRTTHLLAEALAKAQVELKAERDNWRAAANQAVADRDHNKRQWDKCAAELAAVLNGFDEIDAADAEAESVEAAE